MKKNLPIMRQDTTTILHRSKSLISVTQKILTYTSKLPSEIIEEWIEEFWSWADKNKLPELEWIENPFSDEGYWCGVPRKDKELINIRELGLSQFQISELPKEIGNLTNLSALWLTKNNLTTLPKEIGNLIGLKKISLSDNQLESLPREICKLTQLDELWLTGNPNLILTTSQKEWLSMLRENNCKIEIDENSSMVNTLVSGDMADGDDFLPYFGKYNFELGAVDDLNHDWIDNCEPSQELIEDYDDISSEINYNILFDPEDEVWTDEETGLTWEVDSKMRKFVWSGDYIGQALNPQELADDIKDIFSYAEELSTKHYGGYSDWRVPTFVELITLLTEEYNENGFHMPRVLSGNASFYYWSATSYEENPSEAWALNFYDGGVYTDLKEKGMAIMCVRGTNRHPKSIADFSFKY